MLYPFMTLNDNTEIVHSETIETNGHEQVKVVIEKPVVGGFHSATCWLPEYKWENINGFSEEEIKYFQDYLASVAHLIIEFSKESNILNASSSARMNEEIDCAPEYMYENSYEYLDMEAVV